MIINLYLLNNKLIITLFLKMKTLSLRNFPPVHFLNFSRGDSL